MHAYVARICTSFIDVPDKIAIAIYFSGCTIHCKDCQNKELWNKESGYKTTIEELLAKIDHHTISNSVVFLGGEPTDQVKFLEKLCEHITKQTDKQKVLYTGREFEQLPRTLTDHLDMIICGPYRSDLHIGGWPASSNQRILIKKDKLWTRSKHKPA